MTSLVKVFFLGFKEKNTSGDYLFYMVSNYPPLSEASRGVYAPSLTLPYYLSVLSIQFFLLQAKWCHATASCKGELAQKTASYNWYIILVPKPVFKFNFSKTVFGFSFTSQIGITVANVKLDFWFPISLRDSFRRCSGSSSSQLNPHWQEKFPYSASS